MRKKSILLACFVCVVNLLSAGEAASLRYAYGYAAKEAYAPMGLYRFPLPAVGEKDILVDILYAGICHSDIHLVKDEHGPMVEYPYVPGHEIVGCVKAIGSGESKFKVGDVVAIGSMIGSCGQCTYCEAGLEQHCIRGAKWTGGGYATAMVLNEKWAVAVPEDMPVERAAPLMCAGITVYSPLKRLNIRKGDTVAVAGMGGLGHLAVKYAVATGAEVTVFEVTDAKAVLAKKMGAVDYVNTMKNPRALERHRNKFTGIISTIPAKFDVQPYIDALKDRGTLVLLGMPPLGQNILTFDCHSLISGGKKLLGSSIGGMKETEEMLAYSAVHRIYPDVEVITAEKINEAFDRVRRGDVLFRFVIDTQSIKGEWLDGNGDLK